MKNISNEMRKINIYTTVTVVVFIFLIVIVFSRLLYLNSKSQMISYNYNFYTGIMPAFLVMYFGVDSIFYLLYRRIKAKKGHYRKVLLSWAMECVVPLISILFLILSGESLVLNSHLFIYLTADIVPFLISLSMPIILWRKY